MQRLIEELQDRGYHSVERFERLCTMAHSSDPKNELSITIHDSDASVTHEMIGEVARWTDVAGMDRVLALMTTDVGGGTDTDCLAELLGSPQLLQETRLLPDGIEKMAYVRVHDTVRRCWPRIKGGAALAPVGGFHVSIRKRDGLLSVDYIASAYSDHHVRLYILALLHLCRAEGIALHASSFMAGAFEERFRALYSLDDPEMCLDKVQSGVEAYGVVIYDITKRDPHVWERWPLDDIAVGVEAADSAYPDMWQRVVGLDWAQIRRWLLLVLRLLWLALY